MSKQAMEMALFALKQYVDFSHEYDLGGGDVVIATCESRELAVHAIAALKEAIKQQGKTALEQYARCEGDSEPDPLERLRFFCSCAIKGQDWLDVEPFFDTLSKAQGEPIGYANQQAIEYLRDGLSDETSVFTELSEDYSVPLYASAPSIPAGAPPIEAISSLLSQAMDMAVANGANSQSMPDEYVEIAAWLCNIDASTSYK